MPLILAVWCQMKSRNGFEDVNIKYQVSTLDRMTETFPGAQNLVNQHCFSTVVMLFASRFL